LDEIWCGRYAIGNTNMVDEHACEVGLTLVTLENNMEVLLRRKKTTFKMYIYAFW
jgi:hypothetical protein